MKINKTIKEFLKGITIIVLSFIVLFAYVKFGFILIFVANYNISPIIYFTFNFVIGYITYKKYNFRRLSALHIIINTIFSLLIFALGVGMMGI